MTEDAIKIDIPDYSYCIGDSAAIVRHYESVDLTVARNGRDCNILIDGKRLPNRLCKSFRLVSSVESDTVVEIDCYVEDDEGKIVTLLGKPALMTDTLLPKRLTINGLTIIGRELPASPAKGTILK